MEIMSLLSTLMLFSMFFYGFYMSYKRKELIRYVVYGFLLVLLVYILKFLFGFSRPSDDALLFSFDKYSFPSTHATLSMGYALYINSVWAYVFSFVISILRIYIEVHYYRDIFAGWLLSFLIYGFVFKFRSLHKFYLKHKPLLLRKILHISFGSLLLLVLYFYPEHFYLFALMSCLLYFGFYLTSAGKRIYKSVKYKERRYDFLSPFFMIASMTLTLILFGRDYAVVGSIYLIFSDALSTIIGKIIKFGKTYTYRHLSGSFVGGLTGLVITNLMYPFDISLISSLTFLIIEMFIPKKINDNLIIPLIIGGVLFVYGALL